MYKSVLYFCKTDSWKQDCWVNEDVYLKLLMDIQKGACAEKSV